MPKLRGHRVAAGVPEPGTSALTSTRARARPCRRFQSGRKVVTAAASAARSSSRGGGGSGRRIGPEVQTIREQEASRLAAAPRLGPPAGPAPAPPRRGPRPSRSVSAQGRRRGVQLSSGEVRNLLRLKIFSGPEAFIFLAPKECPRSSCGRERSRCGGMRPGGAHSRR